MPLPTDLQLDASAVIDGIGMDKALRVQCFQAARLAMMRSWVDDRTIRLLKTDTADMHADILSKPLNPPASFGPKQRLLLTGRR